MIDRARLRSLMADHGITQAELARRVGVTQQAVGKLVAGHSAGSRFLHLLARELGTTPAYLTGETNDPDSEFPDHLVDATEMGWVEQLRLLDEPDRKTVLALVGSLIRKTSPSASVHAPGLAFRRG